jgi:hypothetical protein
MAHCRPGRVASAALDLAPPRCGFMRTFCDFAVQPFILMAGDHHVVLFAVFSLLVENLFPHRPLQRCRRQLQQWRISPAPHDEVAGIFVVHHLIKFVFVWIGARR